MYTGAGAYGEYCLTTSNFQLVLFLFDQFCHSYPPTRGGGGGSEFYSTISNNI